MAIKEESAERLRHKQVLAHPDQAGRPWDQAQQELQELLACHLLQTLGVAVAAAVKAASTTGVLAVLEEQALASTRLVVAEVAEVVLEQMAVVVLLLLQVPSFWSQFRVVLVVGEVVVAEREVQQPL